jgi:hypothetical protein
MIYRIDGETELHRPDNYEITVTRGGRTDVANDTAFLFRTEDDFRNWAARDNRRTGENISSLVTALDQLSLVRRGKEDRIQRELQQRQAALVSPITGLTLYEHINYGGRSLGDATLIPYPDLRWQNFSDLTSSMKVAVPVCAVFEHIWFKGRSWWIWGPTDISWVGDWWNDRISSCVCGPSWEEIIAAINILIAL